jgi:molybdopterin-containing oxidoreductase family molybdopterin binding subunit
MNCRLYAHVRDGKLVQTSAAPFPDPSYNRICLRGLSHPQRVNSKDRILHPMKRVGKRGENKFEQITWDEAIDILADNLNKIKEKKIRIESRCIFTLVG